MSRRRNGDPTFGGRIRAYGVRTLLCVMCAALIVPAAGLADTVPIVNDGGLPWGSVTATTPIEAFAGQIASTISGRSVTVRCEGEYDWGVLAAQQRLDPNSELGYVPFWIKTFNGAPVGAPYADTFTELSPIVCAHLNAFALAPAKPTKCSVTRTVPQQTTRIVRKKVTTTKRVKVRVAGHIVLRTKRVTTWRTRTVTDTTYVQVTDPPAPCYLGSATPRTTQPDPYWSEYFWYGRTMMTLAHESIHLSNDMSEMRAACYGLQWVRYVALQLGATADDAAAIAAYASDYAYPQYKSSPGYWSPDCVNGGALDLRPADPVWP